MMANSEFDVVLEKLKQERAEAHNFMGWVDDWWKKNDKERGTPDMVKRDFLFKRYREL